jgi:hypothetical protein
MMEIDFALPARRGGLREIIKGNAMEIPAAAGKLREI